MAYSAIDPLGAPDERGAVLDLPQPELAEYKITYKGQQFKLKVPASLSPEEVKATFANAYQNELAKSAGVIGGVSPLSESNLENYAAGGGQALVSGARGIGQLLNMVSQADIDEAKRIDAPLLNSKAGMAGAITGNLALLLGPGAALSGAARAAGAGPRVLSAVDALSVPRSALGGAAQGATLGAIEPVASDESRLKHTLIGGGFGGVGTAAANFIGRVLGPRAATITPEQGQLIQRALDLGYDLKPSEITGKQWQRNLEAALAQMPTTSGRMQAIGARNQETTNRLVDQAVQMAGGDIGQETAAAAAMRGSEQGLATEQGKLQAAYNNLLRGREVDLEQARNPLEALRAQQTALPESSRSPKGMAALNDLLGARNYQPPVRSGGGAPVVNPNEDDVITAIRKLGGLNPEDEAIGRQLAGQYVFSPDPRHGPVWRNPQSTGRGVTGTSAGHSLDRMAELLHGYGYIQDRNALGDVMSLIEDASMGKPVYSMYHTPPNADPLAAAIEKLTAQMEQKNAPAAPKAGYIRDQSPVPGKVAQDMRSDYTLKSAEEKGSDRLLYGEMKAAIDGAINRSLPEPLRNEFSAINKRYGIYAGLEAMSPKQQHVFLEQLYRGSKSPDQFYTFLGMAPEGEFKDVARGFVSKLVEGATNPDTGNVAAAKLGRDINRQNSQAMQYFGGDAGSLLSDIGAIGGNVLRDQVPNSGTAQRLGFQSLLTGGGALGGGYLGSDRGGTPGAIAGTAAGMFLLPRAAQKAYLSKLLRPSVGGAMGRNALVNQEVLDRVLPLLSRGTLSLAELAQ